MARGDQTSRAMRGHADLVQLHSAVVPTGDADSDTDLIRPSRMAVFQYWNGPVADFVAFYGADSDLACCDQ